MGKSRNSGLGQGVGTSSQGSFRQGYYENKIDELMKYEPMPFDSSNFDYSESEPKYDGYLLDLEHENGGSKAKFLKDTLGYKKGDGKELHKAISEAINGKLPDKVEKTNFGTKYTFKVEIKGKDGTYKPANVVAVLQNDNGKKTWRIITLYPNKKI